MFSTGSFTGVILADLWFKYANQSSTTVYILDDENSLKNIGILIPLKRWTHIVRNS